MVEHNKVNVKLSDTLLKKLKTAVKNKAGATLRISLKMFNGNNLPHELLLATTTPSFTFIMSFPDFVFNTNPIQD